MDENVQRFRHAGFDIRGYDSSENCFRYLPLEEFEVDGIVYDPKSHADVVTRPMIQSFANGKVTQTQWHALCGWCDGSKCLKAKR